MGTILDTGWREDLVAAHREVAERIARAGTWWSGYERVAIATEQRRALDHADLPPWEAPSGIDGMIPADHPLPPAAVDAVWRLTNHPGTLTEDWHDEIVDQLGASERYVELVGIVAAMSSLDRFALAMGLDPIPLPAPDDDLPSFERVEGAAITTHWVPTVGERGPNVLSALSAVPDVAELISILGAAQYVPWDALLGDLAWTRGALDRAQVELVAAATSLVNECFY